MADESHSGISFAQQRQLGSLGRSGQGLGSLPSALEPLLQSWCCKEVVRGLIWSQRELMLAGARVTLNGSGTRSLWRAEGVSRRKPQASTFSSICLVCSLRLIWRWDSSRGTRKAFKEANRRCFVKQWTPVVPEPAWEFHACKDGTGVGEATKRREHISFHSPVGRTVQRLQNPCVALGTLVRESHPPA